MIILGRTRTTKIKEKNDAGMDQINKADLKFLFILLQNPSPFRWTFYLAKYNSEYLNAVNKSSIIKY